jgi:hypothetical protein
MVGVRPRRFVFSCVTYLKQAERRSAPISVLKDWSKTGGGRISAPKYVLEGSASRGFVHQG